MKTIDDAIHGIRYHSSTWYYVYYIIYETIDRYMYAYYMCMCTHVCIVKGVWYMYSYNIPVWILF